MLAAQQALVAAAAVEVERAADFDFGAGTFSNFIFSDSQSLEGFARLQKQFQEGEAPVMTRDQLQRRPCWGIHRRQSRESRELCPTKDSKQLEKKKKVFEWNFVGFNWNFSFNSKNSKCLKMFSGFL